MFQGTRSLQKITSLLSLKLTSKAPENRPSQKETIVFQPSIFRCYVCFRKVGSILKAPGRLAFYALWDHRQPSKRAGAAETCDFTQQQRYEIGISQMYRRIANYTRVSMVLSKWIITPIEVGCKSPK